jgi:hypothetical protein
MLNDPTFQKYAAIVLAMVSAAWLVWRAWTRRKKPGCGGDCACPADEIRKKLKR